MKGKTDKSSAIETGNMAGMPVKCDHTVVVAVYRMWIYAPVKRMGSVHLKEERVQHWVVQMEIHIPFVHV